MLRKLTRWRELAPLLIVVLLLSTAISSTSLLLSGSANAFLSAPGTGTNVVILSGGGRVPETGAIDLSQVRNATAVPGVEAESPEVYALAQSGPDVVVVRGVNFTAFQQVQPVTVSRVSGPFVDGNEVLIGNELSQVTGLQAGQSITLKGLLANSTASVYIGAVFSSGAPFDREMISSLQLARELRGLSPDQVTFERLKVNPTTFEMGRLVKAVAGRPSTGGGQPNPFIQQLQLSPTSSLISILPAGVNSQPTLATALTRGLGLAQTAFESLDAVVLLVSLLAVYFATANWLEGLRPTAGTLSSLGLAGRGLLLWLLGATVPAAIVAGLAGYFLAYQTVQSLSGSGALSFFFQSLVVTVDPNTIALTCVGPAAAVALSILIAHGRAKATIGEAR